MGIEGLNDPLPSDDDEDVAPDAAEPGDPMPDQVKEHMTENVTLPGDIQPDEVDQPDADGVESDNKEEGDAA